MVLGPTSLVVVVAGRLAWLGGAALDSSISARILSIAAVCSAIRLDISTSSLVISTTSATRSLARLVATSASWRRCSPRPHVTGFIQAIARRVGYLLRF